MKESIIKGMKKVHEHMAYHIIFYTMYVYLMTNDPIKLALFPKRFDIFFNILTLVCCGVYIVDIMFRSLFVPSYFFKFFFFTDCLAIFLIVGSAFAFYITYWMTLAFSKLIMVVRITDVVMAYKNWMRVRKYRKKNSKDKQARLNSTSLL